MFIYELVGDESNPVYSKLSAENLERQYSFLRSVVEASLGVQQTVLSIEVIKALNYHAIAGLHIACGEFRPCQVTVGSYEPPAFFQVPALMQMFTNSVNRSWEQADPVVLATYVLWRLNNIHPFVNGNGRTARACAYYVLCLKSGGWLPGTKILPERIRENRAEYVAALQLADQSAATGPLDLSVLHAMIARLLDEQLAEADQN